MNKQLLPPRMPVHLRRWLNPHLKNLHRDWVRSDLCSSANETHPLGKYQNIFKWQQYSSVSAHTQGGIKKLTGWPAGWLWSRISDFDLLCSSQSVVGEWWQAHGYKAGTVTKVTWLSEEKAAWPEKLTATGLFSCTQIILTHWAGETKKYMSNERDVNRAVLTETIISSV